MAKKVHLSDDELIWFFDSETAPVRARAIEAHLETCPLCRARLADLQSASDRYHQFHTRVLKPSLRVDDVQWPELRLQSSATLVKTSFARPILWAAAALAVSCLLLAAIFLPGEAQHRQVSQLLARAVRDAPVQHHRRMRLSIGGESWSRPAVLLRGSHPDGMEHVEALFVKANYSWDDPLSARSFAAWRKQLNDKRDRLTYVADENGQKQFYKLRTETRDGTLRTASLTLRSNDLAAVDGFFEFRDRERVTMEDSGQDSDNDSSKPLRADSPKPAVPAAIEHQVSPSDELRVFAALHEIGADIDEPLTVEPDGTRQHVLVTGIGLSTAREEAIRAALASMPNTVVRFSSAQPPRTNDATANAGNKDSTEVDEPLRRILEEQAGGPQQLQSLTDRTLDASNLLLARTHSLLVLARKFPPGVEATLNETDRSLLRRLRHAHAVDIEETTSHLAEGLKPLLAAPAKESEHSGETASESDASWQAGAGLLFEQVRSLDQSVTKLLGANYSFENGQGVLHQLPDKIEQVESLARRQTHTE